MKKIIIKAIVFVALFCILFYFCQKVLRYKWSVNGGNYCENMDYKNASEESIDVVCFGTSEIFAGVNPIIMYEKAGITSYNLATSYKSAITTYYQLLYALKYQNPDVVICDFSCMFDDVIPNNNEPIYRKIVDCMPDKDIRNALIKDICEVDSSQSFLSWKFPLIRYHSRWNELSPWDFTEDYRAGDACAPYSKGAYISDNLYSGEPIEITPELWNYSKEDSDFSSISIHYYDMFIEECDKRGIRVLAVVPPKLGEASVAASRWNAMKTYFDSKGVEYINYNTYEQVRGLGLVLENDYYNDEHLNINGSAKLSEALADDLKKRFNMESHRGDEYYKSEWEDALEQFHEDYSVD